MRHPRTVCFDWIPGFALSIGLFFTTSGARASTLEPPESEASSTEALGVAITIHPSVSDAKATHNWVEDRASMVVHDRPLAEGDLIQLVVHGGPFDYRISVVLLRQGRVVAPAHQPPEFVCECGSNEMLDRLGSAIEAAAHTLAELAQREREALARAEAEAEAKAREEEERQRREADLAAREQQKTPYQSTKLGRAGIGALGIGGVAMISGIIVTTQPDQTPPASNPGYVVLGIGTAAMVGGLAVLIVDIVRCRRDRARCGKATARALETLHWASRATGGVL